MRTMHILKDIQQIYKRKEVIKREKDAPTIAKHAQQSAIKKNREKKKKKKKKKKKLSA